MAALAADVFRELIACRSVDTPGAVLERNLPVDRDLPPTPTQCGSETRGSAREFGEPYSYAGEFEGGVITHALPTRANAGVASSEGAAAPLALHTEDVHLFPLTPDYVELLCVRLDPGGTARTRLADVSDIAKAIPDDVLEGHSPIHARHGLAGGTCTSTRRRARRRASTRRDTPRSVTRGTRSPMPSVRMDS